MNGMRMKLLRWARCLDESIRKGMKRGGGEQILAGSMKSFALSFLST